MDPNFLEFEQPIAELEAKISELRLVGADNNINIADEIKNLREKSIKLTEKIYSNLSSWQISQVARHPLRPYTLDYIAHIFADFDELHGDRLFADCLLYTSSEPTRLRRISYAVFCLKKKKKKNILIIK